MFINQILDGLKNLHKPQRFFLQTLFSTIMVCQSSINFLSLARHSKLRERTFRRNFRRQFDFSELNRHIIEKCLVSPPVAVAQDASFIKKSGKHTFGLDKFWNGSHWRVEKGLETSVISIIDHQQNASLCLSAAQTPPISPPMSEKPHGRRGLISIFNTLHKSCLIFPPLSNIRWLTAFMPNSNLSAECAAKIFT